MLALERTERRTRCEVIRTLIETEQTSIVDEFPPHEWHGPGACATWAKDFDAWTAAFAETASGDFRARRHLTPFVFGAIDHADHTTNHFDIKIVVGGNLFGARFIAAREPDFPALLIALVAIATLRKLGVLYFLWMRANMGGRRPSRLMLIQMRGWPSSNIRPSTRQSRAAAQYQRAHFASSLY